MSTEVLFLYSGGIQKFLLWLCCWSIKVNCVYKIHLMFVKCMQPEWHGTRDYGKHRENNVAPDLKILKLSWRERLMTYDFKEKLNNK